MATVAYLHYSSYFLLYFQIDTSLLCDYTYLTVLLFRSLLYFFEHARRTVSNLLLYYRFVTKPLLPDIHTFSPVYSNRTTTLNKAAKPARNISSRCVFRSTKRTRVWYWRTSTARIRTRRTRRTSCASSPSRTIRTTFALSFS